MIVNKTLVAAPMRTRISKLRIGSGDVFIKLRRPFDALNLELSENTQEVIRHAVQSMRLNSTQKIVFHVSSTKAGAQKVEELFSNRQPPKIPDDAPPIVKQLLQAEIEKFKFAPALQLARELGFKEVVCRHSPNSGAPELLLQHEAPAFELSGLDGKTIQWPEWRGDRPALITFWVLRVAPAVLKLHTCLAYMKSTVVRLPFLESTRMTNLWKLFKRMCPEKTSNIQSLSAAVNWLNRFIT